VVGIDSSAVAIAAARTHGQGLTGVRFERADLAALPSPDACFDGVRTDRTLQHLAQPEIAVRELVRVTRSGGHVVFSEGTFAGPGSASTQTRRTHQAPGLAAFLPLLLNRSGVVNIGIEYSEATVDAGPEVLEILGMRAGPLKVKVVQITGIVTR